MPLTFEATFENGMLKPAVSLPLTEQQRVQVTVHTRLDIDAALAAVDRLHGVVPWQGDPKIVEEIAMSPEYSSRESP